MASANGKLVYFFTFYIYIPMFFFFLFAFVLYKYEGLNWFLPKIKSYTSIIDIISKKWSISILVRIAYNRYNMH